MLYFDEGMETRFEHDGTINTPENDMITAQDTDILKQILPKIDYTAALVPDAGKEAVRMACETAKSPRGGSR
ncbi:MAG: hypothetical protein GX911_04730 [Spirochaetales bacterium]|nr:hypothetical protein [Spirochaetales bacterium]